MLTQLPVSVSSAHEEEGTAIILLMEGEREGWLEVPGLERGLHSSSCL